MFPLCGREFRLQKVGLVRPGYPLSCHSLAGNVRASTAIVILKNSDKIGTVQATGYWPSGIIAAGAVQRAALLHAGLVRGWAYVEAGALDIKADAEIGSTMLLTQLGAELRKCTSGPAREHTPGGVYPWIREVYPFENCLVYSIGEKLYRQQYRINQINGASSFVGVSIQIRQAVSDVTACGSMSMPRSQTGARYSSAPPKGMNQTFSTGGRNSELVSQIVRDWSNILEAVGMYLEYIRSSNRMPMRPSFYPVAIANNKVGRALVSGGLDYYDFATWAAGQQKPKQAAVKRQASDMRVTSGLSV